MYKAILSVAVGSLFLSGCASLTGSGDWKEVFDTSSEVTEYEDTLSRGLYAVAGIGPSRLEPDTSELVNWDPNDRVEPAGQVTLGIDLTKHLSIEAHSADLGSAGLSPSGRINYHIDGVSALVYAGGNRDRYRRQGLTAFGRVGIGALENTPVGNVPYMQENSTHVLLGLGAEYMTPIGVGLRAEAVSFDEDVQYAQLGLMYRTGAKQMVRRPKLAEERKPIERPVKLAKVPAPPPAPPVAAKPAPAPDRCAGLGGELDGVEFQNDSAELTRDSMQILNDVAYVLSTCKTAQVEVTAHTDARGPESYNQQLSERRAQSVVDYLATRGLRKNRFSTSAMGELSPIDTNATAEGRARNRRAEIYAQ